MGRLSQVRQGPAVRAEPELLANVHNAHLEQHRADPEQLQHRVLRHLWKQQPPEALLLNRPEEHLHRNKSARPKRLRPDSVRTEAAKRRVGPEAAAQVLHSRSHKRSGLLARAKRLPNCLGLLQTAVLAVDLRAAHRCFSWNLLQIKLILDSNTITKFRIHICDFNNAELHHILNIQV